MVQSQKILITGAAGFVGTALCRQLHHRGFALRVVVRRGGSRLPEDLICDLDDVIEVADIMDDSAWSDLLVGVDRVVHLAGRAYTGGQSTAADLYFRDNLDVTVALARAVLAARVKQFIFVSTIKVNGEGVLKPDHHHPYKISDRPRPRGAYAVSKWRAEQELNSLFDCAEAPELVILRPPMIYGDAVKGNSAFLQKWLFWGLPLPVPRNGNRRSLLALENLLEIITDLLSGTVRAGSKLLLPCDQKEWSTERLAKYLALKAGCKARILAVPGSLMFGLMAIINRDNFFVKIYGSLRIEKD
jgi:nucleoside-diphosphate-sugar epimerase